MYLLFYKLRLLFHLAIFGLQYGFFVKNVGRILLIIVIGGATIGIIWSGLTKNPEALTQNMDIENYTPSTMENYQKQQLTSEELEQQLVIWQKIEKRQPQSEDIIVNIILLHLAKNDPKSAIPYLSLLQKLNPQHHLISEYIQ